jgi:hypothetical protein
VKAKLNCNGSLSYQRKSERERDREKERVGDKKRLP